jgi:hypothetical protein
MGITPPEWSTDDQDCQQGPCPAGEDMPQQAELVSPDRAARAAVRSPSAYGGPRLDQKVAS